MTTMHPDQDRVQVFRLTSKQLEGPAYLYYFDGALAGIDAGLARPNAAQWLFLLEGIAFRAADVAPQLGQAVIELLEPKSVQDKVVLFSIFFRKYRGVNYAAKILEKANLKGVAVTKQLLTTFFESPLSNFTLSNYIARINLTKDHTRNGNEIQKPRFPDVYDRATEARLSGQELSEYYQHLYKLGWRRDTTGGVGTVWKFTPALAT